MPRDRQHQTPTHESAQPSLISDAPLEAELNLKPRQAAVIRAQQTIGNAAVRRQLVQREPDQPANNTGGNTNEASGSISDILVWTVPDMSGDLSAATAAAIEAQGHAQSLVDNSQMMEAGWNAMAGEQVTGANVPSELVSIGRAGRADMAATKKAVDSAASHRDAARAKTDAARSVS
jgi:hypothetical protein